MITVKQVRRKDGEIFPSELSFPTPEKALGHLIEVHFEWGGQVLELDEEKVTVRSTCMNCVDTDTYSGSAEEMKELFYTALYHLQAYAEHGQEIEQCVLEAMEKWPEKYRGVPLIIKMAAPMMFGAAQGKVAAMLAYGVKDQKELKAGLMIPVGDLLAALGLTREVGCTFREAIALA